MLENVKIIMDETSKQSLDTLRGNLSELLAPLEELPQRLDAKLDGIKDEIGNLSDDTRKRFEDLEEAMDLSPLRKDLRNLAEGQATLIKKLDAISKALDDFEASFTQIDWDSPIKKASE
ncbi:MAG: hypothetical protein IJS08_07090 [Victivallales bacterium]|nr:hypothetical protein [Victivallales bacterium]